MRITTFLAGGALAAFAGLALAQDTGGAVAATQAQADAATEADAPPALEDLLWIARPVVIFADTPNDPRFAQQMQMLEQRSDEIAERGVIVLTDTNPAAAGPLRKELRPRGFGLVLIDKDGTVVQRRPAPTTSRELINMIDRLPSRRQESGSLRQ